MSNQETLTKAIEKAIAGGWSDLNSLESIEFVSATNRNITLKGWVEFVDEGNTDEARQEITFNYQELIYNHDFAKSLWSDKKEYGVKGNGQQRILGDVSNWKWHLQQMVIADDPITYLGENI